MPISSKNPDSLLAIDVGAVTTRAMLFDVVDGRYRFLAAGKAPTTVGAPFQDIGEGIHTALEELQSITGRVFLGGEGRLVIPSTLDGIGIDQCVATLSAGAPMRVVAVGLLEDISAESAVQLASTTYARVVDKLSLNDRRLPAARLDSILHLRPDLVIVAGGTEGGASRSVLNLLESVGLACYLFPQGQRPDVLFAGNRQLEGEVKSSLGSITHLSIAPNIRPSIDTEQLDPAQAQLTQIFRSVSCRKIPGAPELDTWTSGRLTPSATAFGRIVRFLSRYLDPMSGAALGVDIGASATTLAAAFAGDLILGVYTDLGLGGNLPGILDHTSVEDILRWLPVDLPAADIRDYIYNKSVYPYRLPVSAEDLAIEQALARQAMRAALSQLSVRFPKTAARSAPGLLPRFEPIVASGSVLTHAPTLGQSLLMVLDGLQPTGFTYLMLDQNDLLPALGAAIGVNNYVPVQVVGSNSLLALGAVISPVGVARHGAPVLRVKVTYDDGHESNHEIKYGSLEVIPLPPGKSASLQLQPVNRFDVGMGWPGRGGKVERVSGGALGLIIDARGRPLRLPKEPERRQELLKKWLWAFGG